MRRLGVAAALLTVAACSSPSHPTSAGGATAPARTTSAVDSPSPDPTDTPGLLITLLDEASGAEESWTQDHDDYTSSVADLVTAGLHPRPGVTLTATAYGIDAFCLVATAGDGTTTSYVSALDADHQDGYLYPGDVCSTHASGHPFPSPSPAPSPTGAAAVDAALLSAADAEESLFNVSNAYTTDVASLEGKDGYVTQPGVTLTARLIGTDGYCLDGVGNGVHHHYSSNDSDVTDGSCTDPG